MVYLVHFSFGLETCGMNNFPPKNRVRRGIRVIGGVLYFIQNCRILTHGTLEFGKRLASLARSSKMCLLGNLKLSWTGDFAPCFLDITYSFRGHAAELGNFGNATADFIKTRRRASLDTFAIRLTQCWNNGHSWPLIWTQWTHCFHWTGLFHCVHCTAIVSNGRRQCIPFHCVHSTAIVVSIRGQECLLFQYYVNCTANVSIGRPVCPLDVHCVH